ncbi:MAG: hypothetical protein KF752_19690 [Pirellulaceae bacterium]|nr:hypothetical protein [Pirellulaceae bacterium]
MLFAFCQSRQFQRKNLRWSLQLGLRTAWACLLIGAMSASVVFGQQLVLPEFPAAQPMNPTTMNPARMNQAVMPPGAGVSPVQELRQHSAGQPTPGLPTSQLRDAQQFTSGLPFVTPAQGRYPTSPYMGPRSMPIYQNVGHQRPTPGMPVSQSQLQGQRAQLPQYQTTAYQAPNFSNNPTPGIYPTSAQQCQVLPPPSLPADGRVPGAYVPPTYTPNWNPSMYSPNNSGYSPIFTMGQENYNVVLGRGIVGQPTVYVPGQYVRNFLRYIFP